MTVRDRFQLTGNAAEIYEAQKVPAIFEPLARLTLEAAALRDGQRVLDVACGTGIVARLAAPMVAPTGRVVGADLNEGMVTVARSFKADGHAPIEWHIADVTALPFPDGAFDLAVCQQGLQFFPDRPAALDDVHRVLAPGGRLFATVWKGVNPLFGAIAEGLRRHVGTDAAERALAPFALGDSEAVAALMRDRGFEDVAVETIPIDRRIGPAEESIPLEIDGGPVAREVAEAGDAVKARIVAETTAALADYRTADGFTIPQPTFLYKARAAD